MSLTSREIVLRAIERRSPPRIPIHYCNRDFEWSDFVNVGWGPAAGFAASEPGLTEWGYVWHRLDETMGQPRNHPLADWANAARYVPPDPWAPDRLEEARA
ncbi:MAG: hypothetical protein GX557_12185, partial [Chloroflexi bacterium]|nr:hypothetical protein [Chloroflexota bacterium]